ncbi:MAG: mRNA interferase HigB [Alphaproteobacteria bacterium]|jgi:mRNA interferase HigB|nr:mRNA interferase HigB [Alphaproteobacteria bacterium]
MALNLIEEGNHIANHRAHRWRTPSAGWMAGAVQAGSNSSWLNPAGSRYGNMVEDIMRLIARSVLQAYAEAHPETAVSLQRWDRLIKSANWASMDDVRRTVPKAKVLNRDRVRFEVAGGNYRLIAAFNFRRQIVLLKFLGTHAEYDEVDALTVAMF